MASGSSAKIIRGHGRVVVNPTADVDGQSYPYGGTEIGRVAMFAVASSGAGLTVEAEGLGRVSEVLEGSIRWSVSFMLRGWDDDAVRLLFPDAYEVGDLSQHATFQVPGATKPGSSALARAVKLLFVPDDPVTVPGLVVYRGVPDMRPATEIVFRRSQELQLPVVMECVQNDAGKILAVGMVHDLEVA